MWLIQGSEQLQVEQGRLESTQNKVRSRQVRYGHERVDRRRAALTDILCDANVGSLLEGAQGPCIHADLR